MKARMTNDNNNKILKIYVHRKNRNVTFLGNYIFKGGSGKKGDFSAQNGVTKYVKGLQK